MAKYAVRIDGLLHSKTAQGGYSKKMLFKNAAQPFFIVKQQ